MGVLNSLKAMADKMIAAEGQGVNIYFVDQDNGGYDPDTSANTSSAPVVVGTKAVLLNFALESTGKTTYNGVLIEKDDREAYVSWQAGFPRDPGVVGDYLVDSANTKWRIMTMKHNNPSGSVEIMYNLLLRR